MGEARVPRWEIVGRLHLPPRRLLDGTQRGEQSWITPISRGSRTRHWYLPARLEAWRLTRRSRRSDRVNPSWNKTWMTFEVQQRYLVARPETDGGDRLCPSCDHRKDEHEWDERTPGCARCSCTTAYWGFPDMDGDKAR